MGEREGGMEGEGRGKGQVERVVEGEEGKGSMIDMDVP